jgi:cobalt/nickel transport system permease protein
MFAAGAAGYVAINVAALATAIELGLQPLLFKDASGTPLYCPFPLEISVPAMMIGHLTLFGLAETLVTAGVVAYLQKSEVELLQLNAPQVAERRKANFSLRPLWAGLALMMILAPLGLLAAGTAWGEWGAEEFADSTTRGAMARASLGYHPPAQAPAGLAKWAQIWSAPLPDYAPAFLRSESLGYMLSAMLGAGLVILCFLILGAITRRLRPPFADEISD